MAENTTEIRAGGLLLKVLISIIFFLPMYGVLLNIMLLKSWQINLKFPHYRQVKGSFSEL